jgi:hypothetical protein
MQLLHTFAGSPGVERQKAASASRSPHGFARAPVHSTLDHKVSAMQPGDGAIAMRAGYENQASFVRNIRAAPDLAPAGHRTMKQWPGHGHI